MWAHECEAVYIQRDAAGGIHVLGPVPMTERASPDDPPARADTDKFRCFWSHRELWHPL
jgi:hypothetical protein